MRVERLKKSQKSEKKINNNDNAEIGLLVMAKKLGMSFEELNELTIDEFFDFIDIWVGEETEEETPREATQEDIDNFYRYM